MGEGNLSREVLMRYLSALARHTKNIWYMRSSLRMFESDDEVERMTAILEGSPKMKLIRIDWLIQTEIVERRKSEEAAED